MHSMCYEMIIMNTECVCEILWYTLIHTSSATVAKAVVMTTIVRCGNHSEHFNAAPYTTRNGTVNAMSGQ